MSTKPVIVLASVALLLVGFVAGRFSAPSEQVAEVEVLVGEEMSADDVFMLHAFQVATQQPYAKMSGEALRITKNVIEKYEMECAFPVPRNTSSFCTKFIAAVDAHSTLNRQYQKQEKLKSVREDLNVLITSQ